MSVFNVLILKELDLTNYEGLGVAEGRGVREGFLVSAAVSAFAGERDVDIRAGARRGLMAIAEEQPILGSEVLVHAGEPLVGMRD